MLVAVQQNKQTLKTEYEEKLEEAQKTWKLRPVVWNQGRTIGAHPLSKLYHKIGLHDIDPDDYGDTGLKKK